MSATEAHTGVAVSSMRSGRCPGYTPPTEVRRELARVVQTIECSVRQVENAIGWRRKCASPIACKCPSTMACFFAPAPHRPRLPPELDALCHNSSQDLFGNRLLAHSHRSVRRCSHVLPGDGLATESVGSPWARSGDTPGKAHTEDLERRDAAPVLRSANDEHRSRRVTCSKPPPGRVGEQRTAARRGSLRTTPRHRKNWRDDIRALRG